MTRAPTSMHMRKDGTVALRASIYLDATVMDQIAAYGLVNDRSVSWVVRQALREFFEKHAVQK